MKRIINLMFAGIFAISSLGFTQGADMVAQGVQTTTINHGKCSMTFPGTPERISDQMLVEGEDFGLQYDVYIASSDTKTVFMLLVAEYPEHVDEQFAQASLEAFLSGILTYNPNNQLLFADMILVGGNEALDFFIRSGATYFKGRAFMLKNQLYLVAMGCEMQSYDEEHYNQFIESFFLSNT